jgi:hypothetical protein
MRFIQMTKNKHLETTRSILQVFQNPEQWTQGIYAEDVSGFPVSVLSPNARCFCLIGAVMYALNTDDVHADAVNDYAKAIARVMNWPTGNIGAGRTRETKALVVFNDTHSYETVMSVLTHVESELSNA